MIFLLLTTALITMTWGLPPSCAALARPVDGEIVRRFAPIGWYGGHWGIDFAAVPGTAVAAAGAGTVTFAGSVAGRLSVTVAHGGGLRTSYSYLEAIAVRAGDRLATGDTVGLSGPAHGEAWLHFSVRIGDRYQDPAPWLVCARSPAPALRLAAVFGPSAYPRVRATRHPRRDLRPSSRRASLRRRVRVP